ncbi:MAG: alpha/beta hydrolase [Mucinivorans sp.]
MEAFMMAHSVAVRYADAGCGTKVVLLLHGYGESMDVWDHFAGLLGKSLRVVRMDLPGSGFSDWGALETIDIDFMASVAAAVLEKLGVEHATIVGHSMGGYVAVAMGELFPERVEGLVMMHSLPLGDTPEKKEHREREIALIAQGKKELLASINPARSFAPNNAYKMQDAIDELSEQIMLTDDRAMMATLRGMAARKDRSDFFEHTNIARLMCFGRHDNYISQEQAQAMIDRSVGAEHQWFESSGHSSFIEEPALAAQRVIDFINKI